MVCDCKDLDSTVSKILDGIGADEILKEQDKVLLKPNLVTDAPHPVTTSPRFCEAVLKYIRKVSDAEIAIAEGTGEPGKSTMEMFHELGFSYLSKDYGITFVDLNEEPSVEYSNPDCRHFPEMHLPEIAFTHFIVSLPVLKRHSLARFTGSLKNMMGFAPPHYYSGSHGYWKKSVFHRALHRSITDLNRYRSPDLTIMDATVGMAQFHLGGPCCDPPVGKIVAGFDAKGVDRKAAEFLDLDWKHIEHLK